MPTNDILIKPDFFKGIIVCKCCIDRNKSIYSKNYKNKLLINMNT